MKYYKYKIYLLLITIFLFQCSSKTDEKQETIEENTVEVKEETNHRENQLQFNDSIFTRWNNYYKSIKPDFSLDKFKLEHSINFGTFPGKVYGNFDEEFDTIYSDFLIFNHNGDKYIDIDSYSWFLDENGKNPSFSPDQEINLVNIKDKTVSRIEFFGPSAWIEDAFWKNDSTVVLLGNGYEQKPFLSVFTFNDSLKNVYSYPDSLEFESKYTKLRFLAKGIEITE